MGQREQILEGFGWKMLPGLYPTGKPLEVDVSYKASKLLLFHDLMSSCFRCTFEIFNFLQLCLSAVHSACRTAQGRLKTSLPGIGRKCYRGINASIEQRSRSQRSAADHSHAAEHSSAQLLLLSTTSAAIWASVITVSASASVI